MERGFPVPGPAPVLDFLGRDRGGGRGWGRGPGSQENWDVVIKPSCKFSQLSGQIFFPPPFLLKIIEISGRGSFPPWPCHWPGPCHGRHTPWASANSTSPPPQEGAITSAAFASYGPLWERPLVHSLKGLSHPEGKMSSLAWPHDLCLSLTLLAAGIGLGNIMPWT